MDLNMVSDMERLTVGGESEVLSNENISSNELEVELGTSKVEQSKRTDYLEWDEFFMTIALAAAQRSKDPATQVGAVIVDENNLIIGIAGYNGFPRGCSDDVLPWSKSSSDPLYNKYFYVCHAEMNAILNCNASSPKNKTLYTNLFPCNECAKSIIQAGIKTVVYLEDKPEKPSMKASKIMFEMAGVETRKFVPKREEITLKFI